MNHLRPPLCQFVDIHGKSSSLRSQNRQYSTEVALNEPVQINEVQYVQASVCGFNTTHYVFQTEIHIVLAWAIASARNIASWISFFAYRDDDIPQFVWPSLHHKSSMFCEKIHPPSTKALRRGSSAKCITNLNTGIYSGAQLHVSMSILSLGNF